MIGNPGETDGEAFGEFHDELRSVARDLLGTAGNETVPWSAISRAGWPGLEAPEEFDGAAATIAEVAVVLDEVGRAAARTPLPGVLALTVPALAAVRRHPLRDSMFRETVAGTEVPVLVLDADRVAWPNAADPGVRLSDPGFRLTSGPLGHVLDGSASFVLDAPEADLLLVPARDDGGRIVLAVLDPDSAGLTVEAIPLVDATRSIGRVAASGAAVRAVWQPRSSGSRMLRMLRARAALAVARDALGTSAAVLDATVEYVGLRAQFGRPVGSFQAVKHTCADMLVQVTVARRLADAAVSALAGIATVDTEDSVSTLAAAELAVARAKAYATEVAVEVAGAGLQLHGGYGYTWESGLHVHLKRATLSRTLFGLPAAHRKFIAARYR
ncbi:acyl-CoA dehydrogenase family protein [Nocardia shimofusensis]|uniref:acyl-CoA dehydrogenase family protein n=1 Tax=Nocardia shimofusensis TaxID=228596 RepID=UPI001FE1A654|nr:acyl-CoA dehydrogenase family protein [Nocardia shimofusensis]